MLVDPEYQPVLDIKINNNGLLDRKSLAFFLKSYAEFYEGVLGLKITQINHITLQKKTK